MPTADQIKAFVTAGHRDLEAVKTMLVVDPDLLEQPHFWSENDPETALQAASHVGNIEIVRYLLKKGARPEITTVAVLGDLKAVGVFLRQDPNLIHTQGAHGIPLLVHAVISGDVALVRFVIEQGAVSGASMALNIAVDVGDADILKLILELNPDRQWKNMKGKTALEVAQEQQQHDLVALLEE